MSAAKAPKVGIFFPSFVWPDTNEMEPIEKVDACLDRCEKYGFDVWVVDHLLVAPGLYGATWLDPLVFLTYAAARTRTVGLGTAILVAPLRQPVLLAKEIASLQALSGDRFQLGVGTGWDAKEFASVGAHVSERGRRTDELLDALETLMGQESGSYAGRHYSFEDVSIVPRVPMPPLWVAGGSRIPDPNEHDVPKIAEPVKRRVLRAGRWLSRASGQQEWVKRDWQQLGQYAEEHGVDPASLTFGHCNWFHFVDASSTEAAVAEQTPAFQRLMGTHRSIDHLRACYLMGTNDDVIERLRDLVDAGCTYLCVGPTSADPDQIDYFAGNVLPELA